MLFEWKLIDKLIRTNYQQAGQQSHYLNFFLVKGMSYYYYCF